MTHPTRHIALPGTTNFRDLGGYTGAGGRSVRWRTLFRSDHLAELTPTSLQTLADMGVCRCADFRGQQECAADSYDWPSLERHALAIEPVMVQQALALVHAGGSMSVAETVVLMQETYRSFVRTQVSSSGMEGHAQRFAQLFNLLLERETPLVFHCTAGKDRTGWAAALVLHALGVPRQVIQQDYLLTNQLYQRPVAIASKAAQAVPQDILDVLWKVQLPFLNSAYALVEREYGPGDDGIHAYLREVIGLDAAALKTLRQQYLV